MIRQRTALRAALVAVIVAAAPAAVADNPKVNTQVFRPSPHLGDLFSVRSSDTLGELAWSVALLASYGKNPLAFVDSSGQLDDHEAIQDQLSLDVLASLRLFDRLSVGLAVPVFLVNDGQDSGFIPLEPIPGQALGDIRLSVKVGLLVRAADEDGFGLAIDLTGGLPTGTRDAFVGDGLSLTPTVVMDLRVGPVLIAANLGAHIRGTARLPFRTDVKTELLWRLGVSVDAVTDVLTLIADAYGSSANYSVENNTYVELLLGGRLAIGDTGLGLTLGAGRGLTRGYGSTKYRVVGGISYATPPVRDRDGDGIPDDRDACPDDPEDLDGFEDDDGCPDLDNDRDGIPDARDACPNDPEDVDGFEDDDGCPDLDNDGDGIPDSRDACPNDAEDVDGFEDDDGCPDPDNDGDGLCDPWVAERGLSERYAHICRGTDRCPNDAEDVDGFEDDDGCPDPDNDGDGIPDGDDDCPNDPTNKCGVVFNPCEIVITEKVFFQYDQAVIKEESYAILNAVASVMLSRAWIEVMQVEGHTDSDGPDDYNLELSQRRAEAVSRYLADRGVAAGRLQARGFGESRPIATNRTAAGRAKNRRVQFIIIRPSQAECEQK